MITLETKLAKATSILEDGNMIAMAMPAYMDLRGFDSISDLQASLEKNQAEMDMFYKFVTASVVSLVCDKAKEFEKGYKNGWS